MIKFFKIVFIVVLFFGMLSFQSSPAFATHSPLDSCLVNIYPEPIVGNHTYLVTFTNNTTGTIGSIINNYYDGSVPKSVISFSDLSSGSGWQFSNYGVNVDSLSIAPSQSITYNVNLNITSSFGGIDIAASSMSNQSVPDFSHDLCDGHRSPSEITYYPTSLISLSVPYFSQNANPWGRSEYDHAYELGVLGMPGSMDWWGCAVTSIAMVLNYHNIKYFDESQITPASLNKWLNDNGGYDYGIGSTGWYSKIKWSTIGTLTKELEEAGKAPYALEHHYIEGNPTAVTKNILDHDLTVGVNLGNENKAFPDILQVKNSQTKMHFVVAKGVNGNEYAINDPEWNYSDLSAFNNTYQFVRRYVPSHTNLSYLTVVVNPDVEILVTDARGKRTGKYVHNGITKTYSEIENAIYAYEAPLSNPGEGSALNNFGTGVNVFQFSKPYNNDYTITLSSNNNTFYTVNISAINEDGEQTHSKVMGSLTPNNDDISFVNYSQEASSIVKRTVTFESTLQDIKELKQLGLIHFSVALSTTALIKNAEKLHEKGIDKASEKLISTAAKFAEKTMERFIDPIAKEILIYDFSELKKMLEN